jgi:hypothetical protein
LQIESHRNDPHNHRQIDKLHQAFKTIDVFNTYSCSLAFLSIEVFSPYLTLTHSQNNVHPQLNNAAHHMHCRSTSEADGPRQTGLAPNRLRQVSTGKRNIEFTFAHAILLARN